jgi:hypothetical protein
MFQNVYLKNLYDIFKLDVNITLEKENSDINILPMSGLIHEIC